MESVLEILVSALLVMNVINQFREHLRYNYLWSAIFMFPLGIIMLSYVSNFISHTSIKDQRYSIQDIYIIFIAKFTKRIMWN